MFGKPKGSTKGAIDSLIGAGTVIKGDIQFAGGLRIDGEVHGNVRATSGTDSRLVISEKACVEGEISVAHVIINGAVNGPVHADEFLELQSRARVCGDVSYNHIELHLGAIVQGRLMQQEHSAQSPTKLKLATQ